MIIKNSIGKTVVRIVLVSLYAILVMRLVGFVMPDTIEYTSETPLGIFLFFYLLIFNLNTEGNLFFDRYLNKNTLGFTFLESGFLFNWALSFCGR